MQYTTDTTIMELAAGCETDGSDFWVTLSRLLGSLRG